MLRHICACFAEDRITSTLLDSLLRLWLEAYKLNVIPLMDLCLDHCFNCRDL